MGSLVYNSSLACFTTGFEKRATPLHSANVWAYTHARQLTSADNRSNEKLSLNFDFCRLLPTAVRSEISNYFHLFRSPQFFWLQNTVTFYFSGILIIIAQYLINSIFSLLVGHSNSSAEWVHVVRHSFSVCWQLKRTQLSACMVTNWSHPEYTTSASCWRICEKHPAATSLF